MNDETLLGIVEDWSYWDSSIPDFTRRQVRLPTALRDSLALVVQGGRRCGKSTLLAQLIEHYELDPSHVAIVNLEDPRLVQKLEPETLDALVDAFRLKHPDEDRLYFFLDETQAVEGWARWLRAQLDRPRGNVFVVTGSNARLLSGELGSVLTGRHLTVELFPLDLREFRGLTPQPEVQVDSYLSEGGFPAPAKLGPPDADLLLRQYLHDIVERDIRERVRARSSRPIRQLVQIVFEAAGSELSLRRAAAAVGIAIETAQSYLEACEAAYLLFGVPYFAYSERKRAHRNRKFYPVDTGLRRISVAPTSGADRGKSLECATFLELRRHTTEVFYWRDEARRQAEVDFVVELEGRVVPIQVTWGETKDRHERALTAFYEQFPQAEEAVIVNRSSFPYLSEQLPSRRLTAEG